MKLLKVTLLNPIRNEEHTIYKWEPRDILLNPGNVESVGFVEEINKAQILMTSGKCVPIAHTMEEFAKMFAEATA